MTKFSARSACRGPQLAMLPLGLEKLLAALKPSSAQVKRTLLGAFGIFQHAFFPSLKKDETYPFLLYEWKEKRSSDFFIAVPLPMCIFWFGTSLARKIKGSPSPRACKKETLSTVIVLGYSDII